MSFPTDTSTQLNNALTLADNYSSTTTPNINFNSTSGIYNPSANVIKIFTNNTDALTIDGNQYLSGNGTGLTNLNYNAISNLPATFPDALTFSTPLSRNTNNVSIDLSLYDTVALRNAALDSYLTTTIASSTYATNTNLNTKESILTFSAPLTRTINAISIDLTPYLSFIVAANTYATKTSLTTLSTNSTLSISNLHLHLHYQLMDTQQAYQI